MAANPALSESEIELAGCVSRLPLILQLADQSKKRNRPKEDSGPKSTTPAAQPNVTPVPATAGSTEIKQESNKINNTFLPTSSSKINQTNERINGEGQDGSQSATETLAYPEASNVQNSSELDVTATAQQQGNAGENGEEENHQDEQQGKTDVAQSQAAFSGFWTGQGDQSQANTYNQDFVMGGSSQGFSGMDWSNGSNFNAMMQMQMQNAMQNGNWNGFPNMMGKLQSL
ncbi:MAG: hypothetical protein Q9165_007610 [Trypethelium subeluteriae]